MGIRRDERGEGREREEEIHDIDEICPKVPEREVRRDRITIEEMRSCMSANKAFRADRGSCFLKNKSVVVQKFTKSRP